MVESHSSNVRVITTIFLGVRIFRKFTVYFTSYHTNIYAFTLDQSNRSMYARDDKDDVLSTLPRVDENETM